MKNALHHSILQKTKISEKEMEILMGLTQKISLQKNEFFVLEGSTAKQLAFVISGILYSYSTNDKGDKHVIQIATQDHWISDPYSFYTQQSAIFNVQVIESCTLLLLSKENLEKAFELIPSMERFFRILVENAYAHVLQRISGIYSESAKERYLKLIQNKPDIIQNVPQHYIASFLGIKPQSLSRIKKSIANKE